MGKRSQARRLRNGQSEMDTQAALYAIDGGWHPDDGNAYKRQDKKHGEKRDQRYVKTIKPRSENQTALMEALATKPLVAALGPAGTGKTYLAVCEAVKALQEGRVARIVLARPAVDAGEQIGYLPGGMEEKLAPFLRPLYDALSDRLSPKQLRDMISEGIIEIAPIGFMRGRTLNNAFIVIDEAQNCTYTQLKMLLTRLGWHSTMAIMGDPRWPRH